MNKNPSTAVNPSTSTNPSTDASISTGQELHKDKNSTSKDLLSSSAAAAYSFPNLQLNQSSLAGVHVPTAEQLTMNTGINALYSAIPGGYDTLGSTYMLPASYMSSSNPYPLSSTLPYGGLSSYGLNASQLGTSMGHLLGPGAASMSSLGSYGATSMPYNLLGNSLISAAQYNSMLFGLRGLSGDYSVPGAFPSTLPMYGLGSSNNGISMSNSTDTTSAASEYFPQGLNSDIIFSGANQTPSFNPLMYSLLSSEGVGAVGTVGQVDDLSGTTAKVSSLSTASDAYSKTGDSSTKTTE